MTAQFTPGPWEAKRFHVFVESKGIVCNIPNPWNDDAERQANTALIAAAPELYEALEEAACLVPANQKAALAKFSAALAKARGDTA